eukprot:TRINITY_DN2157_c0_g1_i2.p1 TRINITY_DN2157_c0_g1~~TRINITY_DN2157_c0_g1_i2.p1  ORF type:complete len:291 (+),score=-7.12 TRINITY_DN2157_c0_g1_i2:734-1606(+)
MPIQPVHLVRIQPMPIQPVHLVLIQPVHLVPIQLVHLPPIQPVQICRTGNLLMSVSQMHTMYPMRILKEECQLPMHKLLPTALITAHCIIQVAPFRFSQFLKNKPQVVAAIYLICYIIAANDCREDDYCSDKCFGWYQWISRMKKKLEEAYGSQAIGMEGQEVTTYLYVFGIICALGYLSLGIRIGRILEQKTMLARFFLIQSQTWEFIAGTILLIILISSVAEIDSRSKLDLFSFCPTSKTNLSYALFKLGSAILLINAILHAIALDIAFFVSLCSYLNRPSVLFCVQM